MFGLWLCETFGCRWPSLCLIKTLMRLHWRPTWGRIGFYSQEKWFKTTSCWSDVKDKQKATSFIQYFPFKIKDGARPQKQQQQQQKIIKMHHLTEGQGFPTARCLLVPRVRLKNCSFKLQHLRKQFLNDFENVWKHLCLISHQAVYWSKFVLIRITVGLVS